ncbi:FtsX-like permease family protein [Lapidilactobacillus mulanensis]|uniref:FtsX-like permease family protein n=1 Tax=Lapidilactobacillus mulanensis TaxID=2485999 RepID=A0ABW4DLX0_9LACO|nr:FtsX-like permease family protein [Lapidilactobacillus mulanensis]
MKNQLQFHLLHRKIRGSWGRFIAIVLIIMLGVLLFVGIKSSGPDLYNNATAYLKSQKASDVQIMSTTGLTDRDVQLAEKMTGAQVQPSKSVDAISSKNSDTIQLYSYAKKDQLNQLYLIKGHLPRKANQIVLDNLASENNYQIGDTIKLTNDQLKRQTYRIVGFATSPLFIHQSSRGTTTVGDGTVDYFAYTATANFKASVYSSVYLRFTSLQNRNSYGTTYQKQIDQKVKKLKTYFAGRAKVRDQEVRSQALKPIDAQEAGLKRAQTQLTLAKQQVQQASQGKVTTTPDISAQEAQLQIAQANITAAKKQVDQLAKTKLYFNDRSDLPGFTGYGDLADRIAAIANVFPLIFFLIAILITFTTITRMVEEERTQIGTFKALGYTRSEISQNYYLYALFAAALGIVIGVIAGTNTLPQIVVSMMQNQYVYPASSVNYDWPTIGIAILLSLFASLGAVLIVVNRELREKPAALMQAKAPKAGKRILLERITPLWRRLSFNQKVSYRNLFRFKSRMWMAILGIAGGTGLILTGFGIRDSIDYSGQTEFHQILNYQSVLSLDDDGAKTTKTAKILKDDSKYRAHLPVYMEMVKLQRSGESVDAVSLYATNQPQKFRQYVKLSQAIPKNGALLSRKAAKLLNVQAGDKLTLRDADNRPYQIKVSGITDNYAGHFIYMCKDYLNEALTKRYQPSTWLVKLKTQTKAQEKKLASQLLKTGEVVNNSYLSTQIDAVDTQTASLRPIVLIFIILSGLLSFIVLYNLTNINVSERIRELSTIKVLGFFDREMTMYVVRENVLLTIMGIIVGLGFGNLLTWFILHQAETADVIFPLIISATGYITAILMTIIFTVIVMIVTHFKLKRVDMIEALKANE